MLIPAKIKILLDVALGVIDAVKPVVTKLVLVVPNCVLNVPDTTAKRETRRANYLTGLRLKQY